MANQSVSIAAKTLTDLTASASLVNGQSYTMQARGSGVYADEQSAPPSDQLASLYVSDGSFFPPFVQGDDNLYVFAQSDCTISIGEGV